MSDFKRILGGLEKLSNPRYPTWTLASFKVFLEEEKLDPNSTSGNSELDGRTIKIKDTLRDDFFEPYTPILTIAVAACMIEAARILVNLGADVDAKDKFGCTALIWACWKGKTDIARVLVKELGADVKVSDKVGFTALMEASRSGHTETVLTLVHELGANIETKAFGGYTVLMRACEYGHTDTLRVLGKMVVDVDAVDATCSR
jgi:ankyrin repeat protein